nr:uncharacterized protein LOC109166091 [Ipomoea batatas]
MLDLDVKQKDRPFGSYLRAVNYRRGTPMTGEQWIAPETTADRKVWNATGKNAAVDGAGKEASGKHTMGTHVPDQQPNGGDSVHASGKGKETVPLEMELGQVGPPHMGQTRTTPLNKVCRLPSPEESCSSTGVRHMFAAGFQTNTSLWPFQMSTISSSSLLSPQPVACSSNIFFTWKTP